MKICASEQVICCDVDNTLVIHGKIKKGQKSVLITNPYTKEQVLMRVHEPHLRLITERLKRGATVIVWSQGGYQWAKAVLNALKIDHENIHVFTKSIAYIDDKPCQEWMGEHVYISPSSDYK